MNWETVRTPAELSFHEAMEEERGTPLYSVEFVTEDRRLTELRLVVGNGFGPVRIMPDGYSGLKVLQPARPKKQTVYVLSGEVARGVDMHEVYLTEGEAQNRKAELEGLGASTSLEVKAVDYYLDENDKPWRPVELSNGK